MMKIVAAVLLASIAAVCWFGNLSSYSCYKYEKQVVHHEQYSSTEYMWLGTMFEQHHGSVDYF